jgi:uncharacterized protein (DUF58 family)
LAEDYRKYIEPQTISKLKSIELKAKLIVEGFITGLHKSPYHGFSVEFAEHRQYAFGDEIRHVDWRVYARTGKYYVKQYEEETNLRGYILLDVSSSMRFASAKKYLPKIEYAAYLAAALSVMMIGQRDAVSLATFSNSIHKYFPPSLKPSHQNLILKTLAETSALVQTTQREKTNTSVALSEFSKRLDKRSLIVIISDFWDDVEKTVAALKHFRHRQNEALAIHIVDKLERDFSFDEDAEMLDAETGELLTTSPKKIQKAYREAFEVHSGQLRRQLTDNSIDYALVDTSQNYDVSLLAYLRKRGGMM